MKFIFIQNRSTQAWFDYYFLFEKKVLYKQQCVLINPHTMCLAELVDCDKLDEGCNGGLPSNAYEAIQKLGGLETEKDYPYEGRGETCHFNKGEVRATVTGALNITTNETQMAQWLVKNGPISIGINANAMQVSYISPADLKVSQSLMELCDPSSSTLAESPTPGKCCVTLQIWTMVC